MTKKIDLIVRIVFFVYSAACLILSPMLTAIMIVPLVLLSAHSLTIIPKAICVVSKDKDVALSVMGTVAKELEVKEIYVFHAESKQEVEGLAIYDDESGMLYEMEEE